MPLHTYDMHALIHTYTESQTHTLRHRDIHTVATDAEERRGASSGGAGTDEGDAVATKKEGVPVRHDCPPRSNTLRWFPREEEPVAN